MCGLLSQMGQQRYAESLPLLQLPARQKGRFRRERALHVLHVPHASDLRVSGLRVSGLRVSGFRARVPNDRGCDRDHARALRELRERAHAHDRAHDRALRENDRNGCGN